MNPPANHRHRTLLLTATSEPRMHKVPLPRLMRSALSLLRRQLHYPIVASVNDIKAAGNINRQSTRPVETGEWQHSLRSASERQLHHVT